MKRPFTAPRPALLLIAGFLAAAPTARAQDKSGTREGLVKLPAAGGTVSAEGSTFAVQGNTGAVSYSVPLPELPGRAGISPALKLSYNPMSGDPASGFGSGWRIDLPAIELSSEFGIPYATAFANSRTGAPLNHNLFRLHGERLYPDPKLWGVNGVWQYRLQTSEQEIRVRYHATSFSVPWGKPVDGVSPSISSGFEVIYPDGRVELYSGNLSIAEGAGSLVTKFPLVFEVHRHGESVAYHYTRANGHSYLREVVFASGLSRYTFDLAPSTSNVYSYKQGFLQTNGRLVQRLLASYNGQLRNRWCFVYSGPTAGKGNVTTAPECSDLAEAESSTLSADTPSHDRLVALLRFGSASAPSASSLHEPRVRFQYSSWNDSDLANRPIVYPATSLQSPGIDASNFELLDVNRDGLPDVLKAVYNDDSQVFFGNADLSKLFLDHSPLTLSRQGVQVSPDLRSSQFHVADINGDSFADLLQFSSGNLYFYDGGDGHTEPYQWRPVSPPNGGFPFDSSTFDNGAALFVDLNQDGWSDVLTTSVDGRGHQQWTVHLNTTWTDAANNWQVSFETLNYAMAIADPPAKLLRDFRSFKIIDVNGDGLPDFTWTNPARGFMCVYENTGAFFQKPQATTLLFGRPELNDSVCGHGVQVQLAIPFFAQNLESWILDVNGDGIKDFVSIGKTASELLIWYGLGDLRFSSPLSLPLNADVRPGDLSRSRVADIDGDGQEEIIVFQPLAPFPNSVVILDFNRTKSSQLIKSGLLTVVETDGGERHDIRYATSTDEVARDKNLSLNPNALHFPAIVAKQVVRSTGRRADHAWTDIDITEYFYHNPYFDPASREFRGFAQVDQLRYGDEFLSTTTQESAFIEDRFATYDPSPLQRQLSGHLLSHSVSSVNATNILRKLADSNSFDPSDLLLHSLSTSTQVQELVQAARLLQKTVNTWKLVPQVSGGDTYFAQLTESTTTDYGATTAGTKTTRRSLSYDADGVLTSERETSSWTGVPFAIDLPDYDRLTTRSFDKARRDLAKFQALDLPSDETVTVNGTLIASVHTDYNPDLGLPAAVRGAIFQPVPPQELLTRAAGTDSDLLAKLRAMAVSKREELLSIGYDSYGNAISLTDSLGLVEEAKYDSNGALPVEHRSVNLEDRTLDQLTSMAYRSDGRLASYFNPLGLKATLEYDELGRRSQLSFSDGGQESYQYRLAFDNLPTLILTTSRRYPDAASVPDGETETVARLEAFRVDGVKLAEIENAENGGVRVLSYNKYNRQKNKTFSYTPYLASTLDGRSISSLQDLFDAGKIPDPAQADSPDQLGTSFRYDPLDRVSRQRLPYGKTIATSQEAWGSLLVESFQTPAKSSNKRSRTLYQIVSPLGLLAKVELGEATGEQAITRFGRDAAGHLTDILLDGESSARSFLYDSAGNLMVQKIPGAGESYILRDARGREVVNLHLSADSKLLDVVETAYDSLDRPTQRWDNGHLRQEQLYDRYPSGYQPTGALMRLAPSPIGLLTIARTFDPNNLYDYEEALGYDLRGSVLNRSVRIGQRTFVENFAYTLDGARTVLVTPRGLRQDFSLNRANRLNRVSVSGPGFSSPEPVIQSVTYNSKNQIESIAYRGGAKSSLAYDPQTLLVERIESTFKDSAGADIKLQDLKYSIDGDLNIAAIDDQLKTSSFGAVDRSAAFYYDWRGELIRASRYQRTTDYAYDASGNFTSNGELGAGPFRADAATRLIPRGTDASPFDYDAFGRLQASPEISDATYDPAGRLLSARTRSGMTVTYGYSAGGARFYKHVVAADGSASEALYPVASYSEEPSGAQSFLFVGSKRLVRFDHGLGAESDRWFYYLQDHLGSSDLLMTADGKPVEQNLYFPYGSEASATDLSPAWADHLAANASSLPTEKSHHRFTGQYLDDETGLYYFGARYYHPKLGRFVTPDPLFMAAPENCEASILGCNLYGYARGNPTSFVDPSGMAEFSWADPEVFDPAIMSLSPTPSTPDLPARELKSLPKEEDWWTGAPRDSGGPFSWAGPPSLPTGEAPAPQKFSLPERTADGPTCPIKPVPSLEAWQDSVRAWRAKEDALQASGSILEQGGPYVYPDTRTRLERIADAFRTYGGRVTNAQDYLEALLPLVGRGRQVEHPQPFGARLPMGTVGPPVPGR